MDMKLRNKTASDVGKGFHSPLYVNNFEFLPYLVTIPKLLFSACPTGSWGPDCSYLCLCRNASTPCDPESGCEACADGWTGPHCDVDVDECLLGMYDGMGY